ncbi:class I SAM-dependent methyltransferase [Crateriforma conspicua]|uniref:Demethylmenaquinone methyltransferase n=1 Tax=Crateriforma conspicua TaxID=2527996 RepID=A0A5C5Y9R4_9PLAN|nr:class I SAM-dependent methyltransferase [Crateriforma conspicua]QDV65791.1 Demethylmenaquinone methyltransferase [Crateriforma conspicua]TWT71191.1 Demethylmenaquinone methyltransferase [Crateriforma conspicua]
MTDWASDLRVLRQLLWHRTTGDTHQERLESFYGRQAGDYDSFRRRMLHGRRPLIDQIDFPEGGTWVDLGCGTGENVLFAGSKAARLKDIHLVDLSPSLLEKAGQRHVADSSTKIQTHLADATLFDLPDQSVDVATFSYSLTMIPDWFAAVENALRMLRPGGILGVTDFFVSRKHADEDLVHHGWLKRTFWQQWFAMDNVFLCGDHLAMLKRRTRVVHLEQHGGKVPYLPLLKAPYYVFLGRK